MAFDSTQKKKIISEFATNSKDTGSARVQVALLTEYIEQLQQHCKKNPKDFSCKRGLLKAVSARRSLLSYLQKQNQAMYRNTLEQLGLRK